MPYKPLSKDSLESAERAVAPALRDPHAAQQLLERLRHFAVYGLLLVPDPSHPIATLVRERWDELHHMTGDRFLLLAFQSPDAYSPDYEASWRTQLGDDFAGAWAQWTADRASSNAAYDYRRMFEDQVIRREDLPCLALFTDPQAKRAAVLPIPHWTGDELWAFLSGVCDVIDACADEPDPDARLAALQRALTSFPARARQKLGHLAERTTAYVTAHPVKVLATSVNVALVLATHHLLPIGAAGVALMKDLLGVAKNA